MQQILDYRNAKYQGSINQQQHRHGFGILIDDDLSFYASTWNQGKLNRSTMIYISHGKYIYGQWLNNQPNGLNVFRIGDTVLLGEFDNGFLLKKALVLFEKLNFLVLLEQHQGQWLITERKTLKNYHDLTKYIQLAGIPIKPQYYSLAKYVNFMSNQKVSASICQGTQNCYFGYKQGLGLIFNSNNIMLSVGYHTNKKLIDFGGIYQIPEYIIQGNFYTNQIIKYPIDKQKPIKKIYTIYQNLHKRSLNFKNQYFDSKIKLLTKIQQFIRNKITQIISSTQNNHNNTNNNTNQQHNNITVFDLNDSLDFHVDTVEHTTQKKCYGFDAKFDHHSDFCLEFETSPKFDTLQSNQDQNVINDKQNSQQAQLGMKTAKDNPAKSKPQKTHPKNQSLPHNEQSSHQVYNLHQDTFANVEFASTNLPKSQKLTTTQLHISKSIKTIRKNQQCPQKPTSKSKSPHQKRSHSQIKPVPSSKPPPNKSPYYNQSSNHQIPQHQKLPKHSLKYPSYQKNIKYPSYQKNLKYLQYPHKIQKQKQKQISENTTTSKIHHKTQSIYLPNNQQLTSENIIQKRKQILRSFQYLNSGLENLSSTPSFPPKNTRTNPNKAPYPLNAFSKNNSLYLTPQPPNPQLQNSYKKQKLIPFQSKIPQPSQFIMPLALCKTNRPTSNFNYPYYLNYQNPLEIQPNKNLLNLRQQPILNKDDFRITRNPCIQDLYTQDIKPPPTAYSILDKHSHQQYYLKTTYNEIIQDKPLKSQSLQKKKTNYKYYFD